MEKQGTGSEKIEIKKLPFYPKTGSLTTADSTQRIMEVLGLKNEKELMRINERKQGMTFFEFLTLFRNHPLVTREITPTKQAYLDMIHTCQNWHEENKKGEPMLDDNKLDTSPHPMYDLYRFYKRY
ncbi:MAG: hypothetical protein WC408_03530 [Candidatus Micrarchaeia archaeon]